MKAIMNRDGNTMGYIQGSWLGDQVATSSWGNTLGRYNPQEDKTYDSWGNYYGEGNLLASLIMENDRER